MTIKFCVKCGKKFMAIGRQVICPDCKAAAEEESKKAAVMRAKRASWTGESVPVRISGRASTIIREYGAENDMPFAQALDALLQASDYFKSTGVKWEEVIPYKSHRRDKATSKPQDTQEVKQDAQEVPQEVKQAARKAATSKAVGKTASKAVKTNTAGKGGKK